MWEAEAATVGDAEAPPCRVTERGRERVLNRVEVERLKRPGQGRRPRHREGRGKEGPTYGRPLKSTVKESLVDGGKGSEGSLKGMGGIVLLELNSRRSRLGRH